MKLLKNFFALFIAVAAIGLTLAANAGVFSNQAPTDCLTQVVYDGQTYVGGETTSLPPVSGIADSFSGVAIDPVTDCPLSGKFCCAVLDNVTKEILEVYDRN